MANPFGDPEDSGSSTNPFGDPEDHQPTYAQQDAKFQADPVTQAAADEHVAERWREFGRAAGASQGQAIRDYARDTYGIQARPHPLPSRDYRPERDADVAAAFVRDQQLAQVGTEGVGRLEDGWRQQFLHHAYGNAQTQQMAAAAPKPAPDPTQQHGLIRGAVDALARGTTQDLIMNQVQGGTSLAYNIADGFNFDPNPSAGAPVPNENDIQRNASEAIVQGWQDKLNEAYPQSTNAANGGLAKYHEGFIQAIPTLVTMAGGLRAGGLQKFLASSQMAGGIFNGSYQDQYRAGMAQGMSDQDARRNATIGGLADAAAQTYMMKFGVEQMMTPATAGTVKQALVNTAREVIGMGGVGASTGMTSEGIKNMTTGESVDWKKVFDATVQNAVLGGGVGATHNAFAYAMTPTPDSTVSGQMRTAADERPRMADPSIPPAGDQTKAADPSIPPGPASGEATDRKGNTVNIPTPDRGAVLNAISDPEMKKAVADGFQPDGGKPGAGGPGVSDSPAPGGGATVDAAKAPAVEPEMDTPKLDKNNPKLRVNNPDGTSEGRPVEFADKTDKALWAATETRQGKVAKEARDYLESKGYDAEKIDRVGEMLRDHVASLHDETPGKEPLKVESTQTEETPHVREPVSDPTGVQGEARPEPAPVHGEATVDRVPPQPERVAEGRQDAPVRGEPAAGGERAGVAREPEATGPVRVKVKRSERSTIDEMRAEAGLPPRDMVDGEKVGANYQPEKKAPKGKSEPATSSDPEVKAAIDDLPRIRPQAKVVAPSRVLRAAAKAAESVLGVKAVHINDAGGAAGFQHPDHPGVVFIDARRPVKSWVSVLGHEWMHHVQQVDPKAADAFFDSLPADAKAKYLSDYKASLGKLKGIDREKYLTPERVKAEIGAMALGDAAMRGRVRREMTGEKAGLWDNIVDTGQHLWDKLTGKSDIIDKAVDLIREQKRPEWMGEAGQDAAAEREKGAPADAPSDPNTNFAPLGAEKFWDKDVKENVKEAFDAFAKVWDGAKRLIAPQARGVGKTVREAANAMRESAAERAQRYDRLVEAFQKTKEAFDKIPMAATRDFIERMETGKPQANPGLQATSDALRAVLDDRLKQVQAHGKLAKFIENYFPHLWKDPTKAGSVLQELNAKSPWEGRKSFLKERHLPLFSDGIARGLEPVTENPVEAVMMRVREMDKYITANNTFKEFMGKHMLWNVPARKEGQYKGLGFARINDNIATIFAPPNRPGGISTAGYWMAPEPIANIINNHLSPGLRSDPYFGKAFRAYLGAGNAMNQAQLGISAFHAFLVSMDSSTGRMALGHEMLWKGEWAKAAKAYGSSVVPLMAGYQNWKMGGLIGQEWVKPGSTGNADAAMAADAMKAAGGRKNMDQFYHNAMWDKMKTAFREGNTIGGAARLPLALVEKAASPILEHLVPRMKMGAFFDIMQHEFKPGMSREELREAGRKAWDSVDNRLGELVYDNLFWNKSVKDLAMASFRAVGWNLGTIRELGGGVLDAGGMVKDAIANREKPEMSHRLAYTIALPILTGMWGGIAHWLMSGSAPSQLKDYYFPASSQKDKDGNPVRYQMPGYMGDVWKYAKDIHTAVEERRPSAALTTIGNKTHPLINMMMEMATNRDYYGDQIVNPNDSLLKEGGQLAGFAAKQAVPFGFRDAGKLASEGQGAKSLLPILGITRARSDIIRSDAENLAGTLQTHGGGGRTPEQVDHGQMVRDLSDSLHRGEPDALDRIRKAASDQTLTQEDLQRIRQDQMHPGLLEREVGRLGPEQAVKVWDAATPEERRRIGASVLQKIRGSKTLTTEQRKDLIAKVQAGWKDLLAGEGK